jgi:pimeloyl-ACP methyl ester carboxylesterase
MERPLDVGRALTEGDELHFEVRGAGTPLLMIAGGAGDAGYYTFVAEILADEFKVITYDRRGHSRSSRREPVNFEVTQQGRDAVAVLSATGHQSALIFGSSGGGVIALELAKNHPGTVQAMVVHEPPVLRMLPDGAEWLARHSEFYALASRGQPMEAMEKFLATTAVPPTLHQHLPADFRARTLLNREHFLLNELLPIGSYTPDIEAIRRNGVRIAVAAGADTMAASAYYGMTAPILSGLLDCPLVLFPGHHVSYMDMPEPWSDTLRTTLAEFTNK